MYQSSLLSGLPIFALFSSSDYLPHHKICSRISYAALLTTSLLSLGWLTGYGMKSLLFTLPKRGILRFFFSLFGSQKSN